MTYTVKNGTWCKDNEKEYYSTTKTGLKAALKAGEITAGTRVVIHDPKYHAGQLIQSLNPECPEGCFVPDGSAFDTSVYTELAAIFPDGNLPDMRECVLVMAGQNEHITTHAHDVFSAGEFKDDQAQLVEHDHGITDTGHGHSINDTGHGHSINDTGHGHSINDTGHDHGITDPGHDHGRGTQEITGKIERIAETFNVQGAASGAFEKEQGYRAGNTPKTTDASDTGALNFIASRTWTGRSEKVETGITVKSATTGITVNNNTTGITVNSATTGITVNNNKTGITVNAKGNNNVTRTKQFGVYYYIAF